MTWGEKGESKGKRAIKPVIIPLSKKWVLKIRFLDVKIDNKYQKEKIKNLE